MGLSCDNSSITGHAATDNENERVLVRHLLQSFSTLSISERNLVAAELVNHFSFIGVAVNKQENIFNKIPLQSTPSKSVVPPENDVQVVNQYVLAFNKLSDSCKAVCLAELVRVIPVMIVVGAFETKEINAGKSSSIKTLVSHGGYQIYPAYPADRVFEAIANACYLRRVKEFSEKDEQVLAQESGYREIFEAFSYQDKLLFVAAMLKRVSIDGGVQGIQGTSFFFPFARPQWYSGICPLANTPFIRLFESLREESRARYLASILRSIPVAIVFGAFSGASSRYVVPAVPVDKPVSALSNAYRAIV